MQYKEEPSNLSEPYGHEVIWSCSFRGSSVVVRGKTAFEAWQKHPHLFGDAMFSECKDWVVEQFDKQKGVLGIVEGITNTEAEWELEDGTICTGVMLSPGKWRWIAFESKG